MCILSFLHGQLSV